MANNPQRVFIQVAEARHLNALLQLEKNCFAVDQLSRRSFKRWLSAEHGILLVALVDDKVVAYGLLWCHKGTRLARLYSLAVDPACRGQGIAGQLIACLERAAAEKNRIYMRLEVAKNNQAAIALYTRLGYSVFGEYCDYYQDHSDALRMQKRILHIDSTKLQRLTPWYRQTTEFTCGPASLMMAMASLDKTLVLSQSMELDIWRLATTIFMTSGHGGCHPLGLALSAHQQGFTAHVFINTNQPLFVESVRSENKRAILRLVHQQFVDQAQAANIPVSLQDLTQQQIADYLNQGKAILMLISTYRLDGKKAPHWVCITGMDERCFYVHDPDPDNDEQAAIDCQYLPIAREDFDSMSAFGSNRLRTGLVLGLITG